MGWLTKHHRYHSYFSFFIILLLMTACGTSNEPEVEILPTVALLPSETSTLDVPDQPTLPPTWTPTATETYTPSPTVTLTVTVTPSLTITNTATITYTPSVTPTQIPRPIVDLIQLAYQATILPNDYVVPERDGIVVTLPPTTPEVETIGGENTDSETGSVVIVGGGSTDIDISTDCAFYPVGGFATAYTSDANTAQLLGCPVGNPPSTMQINGVYQVFERGIMIWVNETPAKIYALYNNGTYQQFADTFDETVDPETGGEIPPSNLFEPERGFGKVWRNFTNVKANLGWATHEEIADFTTIQEFARGQMIYIPARGDVLALVANADGNTGTWASLAGSF